MLIPVAGADARPASRFAQIIHREARWFDVSDAGGIDPPSPQPRILPSRWIGNAGALSEHEAEIAPDCHVIGITLRPIDDVTVFSARQLIHSGPMPAGSVRVNEPGLPLRGIFRGSFDVLHLRVPNTMVAEYAAVSANAGCSQRRTSPLITERPIVDPVIERLARALTHAEDIGGAFGHSYADGISLAITARMFGGTTNDASTQRPRVSGLSKWRLKRATEYMTAHLAETISLADIASAAGLSRMHFAAQFRSATGLRPHEFLLQRRIERARELLLTSRLPLVEIAFDVGFKTQAHFTTVFARFVGETPNAWRQRNRGEFDTGMLRAA
jgi:AraC family transcriptional regulator